MTQLLDMDAVRATLNRLVRPGGLPVTSDDIADIADMHEAANGIARSIDAAIEGRFEEFWELTLELERHVHHLQLHWNSLTSHRTSGDLYI